jgi:hypothetical protein
MTPEERADLDRRIHDFEVWQARREQDEAREFNLRQMGNSYANWDSALCKGFHGRWELLTVEDIKFLIAVGIDPMS